MCLELEETRQVPLVPEDAYCLYGWLMERVSPDFADQLHESNMRPFSQYLFVQRDTPFRAEYHWNLFTEEAAREITPLLCPSKPVLLRGGEKQIRIRRAEQEPFLTADTVEQCFTALEIPTSYKMNFLTPTTFKTEEHYALYPTAELIVKSAVARFAQLGSDVVLEDEKVIAQLAGAAKITTYSLHAKKYRMKASCVQGFTGWVRLAIHGPEPMRRLFRLLMNAAPLTGIGIKTALGMGGCKVEETFGRDLKRNLI
ncbi:CRISPR system precrRNA processing endoribonuclease RAMP protein Cas6 [Anaeromassilibacillus senegalensis]|uniref:CRISPR system precrRNA processing endoribonuclease RAMP protein Cas6 n=1 Tax=Anaeromassilibacillus senegalensis TaxID=1673717 RepID=UPI00068279AF|nr:CRISPR system precrRNA processing endoribonuclease RAMP protein Cas6 [Anaeromassilibacillus senegalensis]